MTEHEEETGRYAPGVHRNARLIVRNLPWQTTEESLKKHFAAHGQIEEVKLLRRPDGKLVGCGFVHFQEHPMANKAIAATNKKQFMGRPLNVSWAVSKDKYTGKMNTENPQTLKRNKTKGSDSKDSVVKVKDEDGNTLKTEGKKEKAARLNRNARLVVRNVSFKATEETLKQHFEPYGDLHEVKLLKKPDGKLVGCAFVHYKNVPMAKKALLNTNMKPFLGRPISVDWAVAKNKYMQHMDEQRLEMQDNVKKEESDSDCDAKPDVNGEIKPEVKSESDSDEENKPDVNEDEESSEVDEEDVSEDEADDAFDDDVDEKPAKKIQLNDAEDGRTVFVTNLSFSVDSERLRSFAEKTAPVDYALVCVDQLTEHSRGTGFIKFKSAEDATRFMSLPAAELSLEGQSMQPRPALTRDHVRGDKKKQARDSRNLYLVKEGVVVAGTKAALGVSTSDMAKRLALERSKTQMLKNLNRFVSRYRLVVSNLPPNWDDARLRRTCAAAVGRGAELTEVRVMRDLRAPVGPDNKHPSKGFGFVMFTRTEDALQCLRKLNNNPEIFDKNNRPIVSFSIEDRTALNARKKRLEKSIANNPLNKKEETGQDNQRRENRKRKNKDTREETPKRSKFEKGKKSQNQNESNTRPGQFVRRPQSEEVAEYAGLTSKQGAQHHMRSNQKLKAQAETHRQNVKVEKKQSKRALQLKKATKERIKQPKMKINKNPKGKKESKTFKAKPVKSVDVKSFNDLVKKYKSKITSNNVVKAKWYE